MSKSVSFAPEAWGQYVGWQGEDRKTIKRINALIQDIDRNEHEGIGKPKPLTMNYAGWWSRRIDEKNRLVYRIEGETIQIASCKYHYGDK